MTVVRKAKQSRSKRSDLRFAKPTELFILQPAIFSFSFLPLFRKILWIVRRKILVDRSIRSVSPSINYRSQIFQSWKFEFLLALIRNQNYSTLFHFVCYFVDNVVNLERKESFMLANYRRKESKLSKKKKNAQIIEIRILSFKQLTRSTWNSNLLDMAIFLFAFSTF